MNNIALYLRLSLEDYNKKNESESIANQRLYLKSYIKKQDDLKCYNMEEYIDDGFSGTNFKRPAFLRMIEDIKNNRINCVIVKDLSRFSRDYIETGKYLENIFPFLGVRFISINDGYDSINNPSNVFDIDMQFKSLLYDFYSKELSQKVKDANRALMEQGKIITWNPSYGYIKDPDDKYKIIIDEEAAEVVRYIFNEILQGKSLCSIAKELNRNNIPTPAQRKKELSNYTFNHVIKTGTNDKKCVWMSQLLSRITSNEIYTGNYVFNKTDFRLGKEIKLPKSEWKYVENTHEAIISKDIFEAVEKIKANNLLNSNYNGISQKTSLKKPFKKQVICKECGHVMRYKKHKHLTYYTCNHCAALNVINNVKAEKVVEKLTEEIGKLKESKALDNLANEKTKTLENSKQINYKQKLIDTEYMLQVTYERYKRGQLTKEEYFKEKELINVKIKKYESLIAKMEEERLIEKAQLKDKQTLDDNSIINDEIMERFIDKIIVAKDGTIEIKIIK